MVTKQVPVPTFPKVNQEAVMEAIAEIRKQLPFLKNLSVEDRRSIARIGSKGVAFVHKAVAIAEQNPQILPSSLTLEQIKSNSDLFDTLTAILIAVDQLRRQLDDTAVLAGGESYAAARNIYLYASAAGPALETATADLGRHFARKSNGAVRSAAPEAEPSVEVAKT
jgi:hypothetical protein